jgi:predicted aspartyl protease
LIRAAPALVLGAALALGGSFASASEPVRRRVPIQWTSAKPSQPYVRLEVGGVETHALVDTGASDHVVSRTFVDDARLPTVPIRAQGVDHGAGAMTLRGLAHGQVQIPGWGPLDPNLSSPKDGLAFAVATVHARFRELGLGAFVSPQRLVAPGHAVIVDLARSELLEVPVGHVRAALEARGDVALFTGGTSACLHGAGPRAGVTWMTDALVEGAHAKLLVDTGAAFGDLFRESSVGRALLTREGTTASIVTAGQSLETQRIEGVALRVGDLQRTDLRWNLVESQGSPVCAYDGVLAIDVLRTCALAFDGKSVAGRCARNDAAAQPPKKGARPRKHRKK